MRDSGKGLVPLIIFAILALSPLSGLAIIFAIVCIVYERRKTKNGGSVLAFHWGKTKDRYSQVLVAYPTSIRFSDWSSSICSLHNADI